MASSALIAALEGSIPGVNFEVGEWRNAHDAKMNDERTACIGQLYWDVPGPEEQEEAHAEFDQKVVQEFKERFAARYPTELSVSARLVRAFVEASETHSTVSIFVIEKLP